MALPVLIKTWQRSINQTIAAQGSIDLTIALLMRTLKNLLIGFGSNPWTVRGSSDGVAAGMDAVDRWSSNASIIAGAPGSAHSWIVLRQAGIHSTFELLITFNYSGSTQYGSIKIAPGSTPFSGGSVTADPTSAQSVTCINQSYLAGLSEGQYRLHVWQSTDGQSTRISAWRGGVNTLFAFFEKPANTPTGWALPSASFWKTDGTNSSAYNDFYQSPSPTQGPIVGRGNATMYMVASGEGIPGNSNILTQWPGIGDVVNSFDSNWLMLPIGLVSITTGNSGRVGTLVDMWWRPTAIANGDTFPNDAANRQFIAHQGLILPWTGGSDVMAVA